MNAGRRLRYPHPKHAIGMVHTALAVFKLIEDAEERNHLWTLLTADHRIGRQLLVELALSVDDRPRSHKLHDRPPIHTEGFQLPFNAPGRVLVPKVDVEHLGH